MSYRFKICDALHGFVRFGESEKQVIDSRSFQRLRYIHQMAAAYLVYPGATHSRFEHSLGVMELATRVYNTLIAEHNRIVPLNKSQEEFDYWRVILRLAALCHDMGHLPFSHTAERSLLPEGGHEKMTLNLIHCEELSAIWKKIGESAEADIAKLSVSDDSQTLSSWEHVLSKIITEDSFGADRIDYLIRDGRYTGVGYGQFDYQQLMDCLRILPNGEELALGITDRGIQSVESLWISRYMMFARVYQHPKVRVYSNHLHRFMCRHYPITVTANMEDYLEYTDYTVLSELAQAAKKGDYDAKCIFKQEESFREVSLSASFQKSRALEDNFGDAVFIDTLSQKGLKEPFLVHTESGKVITCFEVSPFLKNIPPGGKPVCLYVHPQKEASVRQWLIQHGSEG